MKKFEFLESRVAVLSRDDIDTDQIIPARFLRTTERSGLGTHLFEDWRYQPDGEARGEFVLNRPESAGVGILLAGRNFGCGSSREHAVWALLDFGIRAVIAEGFADIFRKNALRNGLLPVSVDADTHRRCLEVAQKGEPFHLDLERRTASAGAELSFSFDVDPFARVCMLDGVDDLEYILRHTDAIASFESRENARA
jgi:3-isopropylmalate/(R)-2-methylmalate dehydratase small subunit